MSVKIFMPSDYFYTKTTCDIYGEVQINDSNNSITYFIVAAHTIDRCEGRYGQHLRHLGHIVSASASVNERQCQDVALSFAYDPETPNIYLVGMSIKLPNVTHVNVLLYDQAKLLELHENMVQTQIDDEESGGDDIDLLHELVRQTHKTPKSERSRRWLRILEYSMGFPMDGLSRIFRYFVPLNSTLKHAEFYKHHQEYQKFRKSKKRTLNLLFDKLLGIAIMLILLCIISHPGDTLLTVSHAVIRQVRYLLNNLKGSPVGLKLNVYLNEFLLDCFNYHINLWAVFLDIIEPVVRQLFVPIALFGLMGFTYQMALLEDLIGVMGLHALCFYIYSAVLYKVEINGLDGLWKVVLGKRFNKLKNRVESYEYSYRQLFLATILFTSLLFLFPTVLVYYVVFTTLRLCLSTVFYMLRQTRRRILEFPLHVLIKFLCGKFYEKESLQLQHIAHTRSPLLQPNNLQMSVFKINVQSSSFGRVLTCSSGVLQELMAVEHKTFKSIFNSIIKGTF